MIKDNSNNLESIKVKKRKNKKKEEYLLKKKKHDKTESGNIRSKIKNHFHKFIIEFMNEQIRVNNEGKQIVKFRKINYNKTK